MTGRGSLVVAIDRLRPEEAVVLAKRYERALEILRGDGVTL